MPTTDVAANLLLERPMPRIGAALRDRQDTIIRRWEQAVNDLLPDAEPLTFQQIRDTLPKVLAQMATTLEANTPEEVAKLFELTKYHGITRYDQAYNVTELLVEYRLLRRLVMEELFGVLSDLTPLEVIAVGTSLDVVMQQAVIAFVEYQKKEIQSASEAQSRYLAFLSHDLRNQLNHATLLLQLHTRTLARTPGQESVAADLESAQRAIFATVAGMERLLRAEQLRKGAVQPRRETVKLRQVATSAAEPHRAELQRKQLTLTNAVPEEARVESDPDLLFLVLNNIIGNAVKYSSRGTISITAEPMAADQPQGWWVSVTDEGPGIAPDKLDRLFDIFTRGETHGQQGLGLGLAIAFSSAKLLGAELRVESAVGKGSTFRMLVPSQLPGTGRSV